MPVDGGTGRKGNVSRADLSAHSMTGYARGSLRLRTA